MGHCTKYDQHAKHTNARGSGGMPHGNFENRSCGILESLPMITLHTFILSQLQIKFKKQDIQLTIIIFYIYITISSCRCLLLSYQATHDSYKDYCLRVLHY